MTDSASTTPAVWSPPAAARVRGTLAVIGGRDESARVYERFGRRISADGYTVGVFEAADADAAARWLAAQDAAPRVLAGSDAGAAAVLDALAGSARVDGAIVAGTPVVRDDDAAPEPAARTACPVHLGVLADASSHATHGVATTALPPREALARIETPVLAVHGGADPVAPAGAAAAYLRALPRLELLETVGGLHDALNDQSHRSVAAHVVLWLERLRTGDVSAPIVRRVA